MNYDTPTKLGEELAGIALRAQTMLEEYEEQMDKLASAKLGVLPDGTPFEDILKELAELKVDYRNAKMLISVIHRAALGAKSTTAYETIKHIRELSSR